MLARFLMRLGRVLSRAARFLLRVLLLPIRLPLYLLGRMFGAVRRFFAFLRRQFPRIRRHGAQGVLRQASSITGVGGRRDEPQLPMIVPEEQQKLYNIRARRMDVIRSAIESDAQEIRKESNVFFRRLGKHEVDPLQREDITDDHIALLAHDAEELVKPEADFDLFPTVDLFYEEVELAAIKKAFGYDKLTYDHRYIFLIDEVRKIVGDNVRNALLYMSLATQIIVYVAIYVLHRYVSTHFLSEEAAALVGGAVTVEVLVGVIGALLSLILLMLVIFYRILFDLINKVNAEVLRNFVNQTFHAISVNFERVTRTLLECDDKIDVVGKEADEFSPELRQRVKEIASAQYVLAFRYMFSELVFRNFMFQIRRNSGFYMLAGISLSLLLFGVAATLVWLGDWTGLLETSVSQYASIAGIACFVMVLLIYGLTFNRPVGKVVDTLGAPAWKRFNQFGYCRTIIDEIIRDKRRILEARARRGGY